MRKRIPAALAAAVLVFMQIGCGAGEGSSARGESLPSDSSYSDSVESIVNNDSADSSIAEDMPSDTESSLASEGFRSFLNWEEDTSEGKVYNIFCKDEEFMNLVARYCEGYTVLDESEDEISNDSAAEGGEDNSESKGSKAFPRAESGDARASVTVYRGEIDGAEIRWLISHDVGESYLISLDFSLDDENESNDVTDLFIVDAADVQKYVDPEIRAAMPLIKDAGLPTSDFNTQYAYIKVMGSGDDGVQRAVSYEVSPGVFMYNRQAALDVLGSDDPANVQEAVSDWEAFDRLAVKAHEKGYAMLADWTDAFDAYAVGVTGDWLTETGGVKIDNMLRMWSDQSEHYIEEGYFATEDQPVFGTFITAKEIMARAAETGEEAGGQYGICAGPCGWFRDGSFIVISATCDQRSLTKKILEEVVFNPDVLQSMKTEGIIPNSRVILPEKISSFEESTPENPEEEDSSISAAEEDEKSMPRITNAVLDYLGGQDPYPVFGEAAGNVKLGHVSVFDWYLCDMYRREFSAYFSGEKDRKEAMKVFYREVSDLISEEE